MCASPAIGLQKMPLSAHSEPGGLLPTQQGAVQLHAYHPFPGISGADRILLANHWPLSSSGTLKVIYDPFTLQNGNEHYKDKQAEANTNPT